MGLALEHRPVLVMGYHLFPNALTALLTARMLGARSVYQATGGPIELIGGGWQSENVLVKRLAWPALLLERMVRAVVRRFDVIVVRGQRARRYMIERAGGRNVQIIPGSIRTDRFCSKPHDRSPDVEWLGRLVPIKQPEQILAVLPVVPDVGDLGELVRTGETGWLINPDQVSDYADGICALLGVAGLWTRVSAAARQAVRNFNGASSVSRRWEALISAEAMPRKAGGAGP